MKEYYQTSIAQIIKHLDTNVETGLSLDQAQNRLVQNGPNRLPSGEEKSFFIIFFLELKDFMAITLIVASLFSLYFREYFDGALILFLVFLNALLSARQKREAFEALSSLKKLSNPICKIIRASQTHLISSDQLVTGDIVFLEAGNVVPADLRIIKASSLKVDESSLTGESLASNKNESVIDESKSLGDQKNILFMGTQVVNGNSIAVVIRTGLQTEMGKIANLLENEKQPQTPLQEKLERFGKRLAFFIGIICIGFFFLGLTQGIHLKEMVLVSIGLAVAAIPEALPTIVSITLALGAKKMVKKNALVQNLTCIESLGSITVICTDKTGTLTENKMKVVHYDIFHDEKNFFLANALSNDVDFIHHKYEGEATELALVEFARTHHYDKTGLKAQYPEVARVPFDSQRKRMSTVHKFDHELVMMVKGAPDSLLPLCDLSYDDLILINQKIDEYAQNGYRVLAFASKKLKDLFPDLLAEESSLRFLGFVGLEDPIRPEAQTAIQTCVHAGIRPIMITGDHRQTAFAIAKKLGIGGHHPKVIDGIEFSKTDDQSLETLIKDVSVYARMSPEQKIKIVKVLQESGEYVAMTGDGVNDAPSLKKAHVGVSMGITGTDVAKQASSLVLLDDNFSTIVKAVEDGRRIYDNILRFILFVLTGNFAEVFVMMIALLLGWPLPLLPIHILWINFITDGLPGLGLINLENTEDVMKRMPRNPKEHILNAGNMGRILGMGALMTVFCLGTFYYFKKINFEYARTTLFWSMGVVQVFYCLELHDAQRGLIYYNFAKAKFLLLIAMLTIGLQLCLVYIPLLNQIFRLTWVSPTHLGILTAISFVLVAISGSFRRRFFSAPHSSAKS